MSTGLKRQERKGIASPATASRGCNHRHRDGHGGAGSISDVPRGEFQAVTLAGIAQNDAEHFKAMLGNRSSTGSTAKLILNLRLTY